MGGHEKRTFCSLSCASRTSAVCPTVPILSSLVSILVSHASTSWRFASYLCESPSIASSWVFLCITFEFVSSQCSRSFVTETGKKEEISNQLQRIKASVSEYLRKLHRKRRNPKISETPQTTRVTTGGMGRGKERNAKSNHRDDRQWELIKKKKEEEIVHPKQSGWVTF